MRIPRNIFILAFIFLARNVCCQTLSICSWNLKDFGSTKSNVEIAFIAETIRNFDIILIQEVVAIDPGGAQAVAQLADVLNRKGAKWDYRISDPTISSSYKTERYAFLCKTSKVSMVGKPWLEKVYQVEIDREPYYATFQIQSTLFTLANFHAIKRDNHPEREVKYFWKLPSQYPALNIIFCGDFNLFETDSVFDQLRNLGYTSLFENQKTTLKQDCTTNDCLESRFDNCFYLTSKVLIIEKGVIPFFKSFSNFQEARHLSDHVPIYFTASVF